MLISFYRYFFLSQQKALPAKLEKYLQTLVFLYQYLSLDLFRKNNLKEILNAVLFF